MSFSGEKLRIMDIFTKQTTTPLTWLHGESYNVMVPKAEKVMYTIICVHVQSNTNVNT